MKKRKFVIILLFITIFFGCQEKKLLLAPDNLVGIWKTTESRYADRSFEFTPSTIIFGIGNRNTLAITETGLKMTEAVQRQPFCCERPEYLLLWTGVLALI